MHVYMNDEHDASGQNGRAGSLVTGEHAVGSEDDVVPRTQGGDALLEEIPTDERDRFIQRFAHAVSRGTLHLDVSPDEAL